MLAVAHLEQPDAGDLIRHRFQGDDASVRSSAKEAPNVWETGQQ